MREAQRVSQEFPGREALFRSAFETAGHGMAIVGLDGRVLEANKAWLAIVGYSREEIVGAGLPVDHASRRRDAPTIPYADIA